MSAFRPSSLFRWNKEASEGGMRFDLFLGMARNFNVNFFAGHVTGRVLSHDWLGLTLDEVWGVFSSSLKESRPLQVNAFVLMDNHFHMLVSWNHSCLFEATELLLSEITESFEQLSGKKVFEEPNKVYLIDSFANYLNVYKYIYRNPVEAGLVQLAEKYKYSSLGVLLGRSTLSLSVVDNLNLICNPRVLQWINSKENLFYKTLIRDHQLF